MRFLSKRILYLVSAGLSLLLAFLIVDSALRAKDRITSEYFAHKEFLFLLKNGEGGKGRSPGEGDIRRIFRKHRVKVKSVSRVGTDIEVKAVEVSWRKLPALIKDLEKDFTIVSLSAVDNTGRGSFSLRVVIR